MAHHLHDLWPLGQAVKTPPFHGGNTGSNPVGVIGICQIVTGHTNNSILAESHHEYSSGPVVQLVRMPACHAGGRGFESRPDRHDIKLSK